MPQVMARRKGKAWARTAGMDAQPAQPGSAAGEEEHDQRGEDHAEVEGLDQPSAALVEAAGAIGLGDQGVQAQQQADAEDGHGEVEGAPQADRADGLGAEAADEEGVDDAHGHPAQLGQDHGPGQPEHGPQLGSHPLPEPTHGVTPILRRVRRGRCRVGRRPGRHGDEGQGSARGVSPASRGLPGRGAT